MEPEKLKPDQIALLLVLGLSLVALPTLYIFVAEPALFDKTDANKLLLLSFSAAAPIFAMVYGVSILGERHSSSHDSSVETNHPIIRRLTFASVATALIFWFFLWGTYSKQAATPDPTRTQFIAPIFVAYIVACLLVVADRFVSWRRKCKNAKTNRQNETPR
ncbi:MAG TPA: hypothetical protein VNU49_06225 [Opitutaceae bacterium]|jgi:hypothetical protein|nr:hypothetical protein [Opitutaceae bacterium]